MMDKLSGKVTEIRRRMYSAKGSHMAQNAVAVFEIPL